MMATHPTVMKGEQSIANYKNTKLATAMTPSKNGGVEQEIYYTFDQYANTHPETKESFNSLVKEVGRFRI